LRFRIEDVSSFSMNMNRDRRRKRNQQGDSGLVESRPLRAVAGQWTHISQHIDEFPVLSERYTSLLYPLAESWNDHFMPLVIDKFKFSFKTAKWIFNTIPHILSKAKEGSPLYQACNAVGCAYLMRMNRSPKAISSQARAYGRAITVINSAFGNPYQYKNDDILLSVWLLNLYEVGH
jgi:hypothetical protein